MELDQAVTPEKDTLVATRDQLFKVAQYVRDELGYEMLSNVTGVDYMGREGDRFEVVYHLYSMSQPEKPGLVLKARAPADNPDFHPFIISGRPVTCRSERFTICMASTSPAIPI